VRRLTADNGNDVDALESCEIIVRVLQRLGPCSFNRLQRETGLPPRTLSKRLDQLSQSKLLRRRPELRLICGGTPYTLVEDSILFQVATWLEPPRFASRMDGGSEEHLTRLLRDRRGRFAGVLASETRSRHQPGHTSEQMFQQDLQQRWTGTGPFMSEKKRRELFRLTADTTTAEVTWEVKD
jgi:hypothetical protein